MKPFIFSIRDREYKATLDPESPDTVTVTGHVRGKSGNLLPNIVPLIVKELTDAGFPASPWVSYWRGAEGGLLFIASQAQAWKMIKAAFQEVVKTDEVCVDCHLAATRIARRSGLAEACGIVVPDHTYWLWMRGINDCYTTRLKELWSEFESPLKGLFEPDRFFVFPVNAYRKGDGTESPQPGDLEWVASRMRHIAVGMHGIFDVQLTVKVTGSNAGSDFEIVIGGDG